MNRVLKVLLAMFAVAAIFVMAQPVLADTIPITNDSSDWTTTNHYLVISYASGGPTLGGNLWRNYWDPSGNVRQVPWMDIGTNWEASIPANQTITSATLTFSEANFASGSSNFSIFAVPGADKGVAAIQAVGTLPQYYAATARYGLVTAAQVNAVGSVTFDITALMAGWKDGTLKTNPGQMMIVGDSTAFAWCDWNASSGETDVGGPTITVTTTTPEPNMLVLLGTGLIGLLAYAWRKRK